MTRLSLSLFGSYRVTRAGKAVPLGASNKAQALLAYLAVESSLAHPREKLAGLLWPDLPESRARQNLSQAVYLLRHALVDPEAPQHYLIISPHSLKFNTGSDYWLDCSELEGLLEACERHPHPQLVTCPACFERLEQAAALYGGSFLADFSLADVIPFEEWATVWRERLHRKAMRALHLLAECLEGRGEIARALEHAWRQVELDPLGEAGYRQVMRLLALSGRRSEALAQFNALQRLLQDSLGVHPDGETWALYEQILAQSPPPAGAPDREVRLPAALTPFIGRQTELTELSALLRDPTCRLVTVFGPGGVGKTRLALEVAQWLAPDFPHGIYFISFSAHQPGNPLWPLLAQALRVSMREKDDPEQQVFDYLAEKEALLILDSFEAALERSSWLADLLQHAPRLTALVTSRARLEASAEQVFNLEGMEAPEPDELELAGQFSAVQLFLAFARHRQPGFALDKRSRAGVARICRLVGGLPLGLLLASAWVELYSPDEIAEQIERSLDFLEADWSDVPLRQRSLRATFDYSWNLLSAEEQRLFTALAVFQGGFTLPTVERVCQAPVRLLRSLVDKSLVSRTLGGRYQIHDLVRQYAAGLLEQNQELDNELRSRHSRYYLEDLGLLEKDLKSARQREALEAIDREAENLRAAWRWAVTTHDWQGIAIGLEGICWYVDLRLRFEEGERACRTALERLSPHSHSSLVSALTAWQAHFLHRLGQSESAGQLLQTGLERLEGLREQGRDMRAEQAQVLYELGELNRYTDRETAKSYYQQSLVLYDDLGDERGLALVLASLGEAMHHSGPLDQAQVLLDRGVLLCRKLGDPRLLARCMIWNGWNQVRQGNLSEGEVLIRASIEINHTIGDRYAEAFWGAELGRIQVWSGGHFEAGLELIAPSIPIYRELGLKQEATFTLLVKALVEMNLLNFQQARQDFQDCVSASYELNYQRVIGVGLFGLGCLALDEEGPQKAEDLFLQAMPILQDVQADEAGWCLALLVFTMRRIRQVQRGWEYAHQGLEIAIKAHVFLTLGMTVRGIAMLLIDEGQVERAIELHEMTHHYPPFEKSPWYYALSGRCVDTAAASLPPEVAEAARERGRGRDLFATAQELLEECQARIALEETRGMPQEAPNS